MSRGGGSRGFSRGGGRGGGRPGGFQNAGPPDQVLEMGSFIHAVEGEMLCSSLMPDKVPYFNAPIYLQNKSLIGKVDEILGPINEVYFSIKMENGVIASSFKKGDKVYIGGDKLLPIERFLPKPKAPPGVKSKFSQAVEEQVDEVGVHREDGAVQGEEVGVGLVGVEAEPEVVDLVEDEEEDEEGLVEARGGRGGFRGS
ncbi:small nucleolar RNP protein [Coprinopsis cinerea okayama7|uniref:H/ACA ribonucleoprotein complex subunit n=1 Tax=Coprinopsis cinerea (strain Okayama-7 / 130 / ATCC MYA-4618 / FGSC 9003) TaxID=240176 RepID=A8NGL5_COPC7|nr:small nucleolar RNP protein [Coprinopsis cinerea okayama7\|eukprot:XP_001833552.1 small nucleolar RNP protein [Coprinopsis cinerea okayama7\